MKLASPLDEELEYIYPVPENEIIKEKDRLVFLGDSSSILDALSNESLKDFVRFSTEFVETQSTPQMVQEVETQVIAQERHDELDNSSIIEPPGLTKTSEDQPPEFFEVVIGNQCEFAGKHVSRCK